MKYSTGATVGGGLGKALSALVNGKANQATAYQNQLDTLVDRDYRQSQTAFNQARMPKLAAETELAQARTAEQNRATGMKEQYLTEAYLDSLAEMAATNPTAAAFRSALVNDGSMSHVGGMSTNLQDANIQREAVEGVRAQNLSGSGLVDALNTLRQKGATQNQVFSNGMSANPVTGEFDLSRAATLNDLNEKSKATHRTGGGAVRADPWSAVRDMFGETTVDRFGTPHRSINMAELQRFMALAAEENIPADRLLEAAAMYVRNLQANPGGAPTPPADGGGIDLTQFDN